MILNSISNQRNKKFIKFHFILYWQKLESLITPLFGKDVKKHKLSTLLMEIKIAETLESRLCVSLHSTRCSPWGSFMYTQEDRYKNIHCNMTCNSKSLILPKYPLTVDSINYGYSHTIKYYIGAKWVHF